MITKSGEAGGKQSKRPLLYTLYISEFFHSAVGHVYVYEHVCYNPYAFGTCISYLYMARYLEFLGVDLPFTIVIEQCHVSMCHCLLQCPIGEMSLLLPTRVNILQSLVRKCDLLSSIREVFLTLATTCTRIQKGILYVDQRYTYFSTLLTWES